MTVFLILLGMALTCVGQAILSSWQNRDGGFSLPIFLFGIGISIWWVLLAKYSTNLLRDALIWDVVIALIYSITFIVMGHGANFTLKHWIGLAMTLGVFIYWSVIK